MVVEIEIPVSQVIGIGNWVTSLPSAVFVAVFLIALGIFCMWLASLGDQQNREAEVLGSVLIFVGALMLAVVIAQGATAFCIERYGFDPLAWRYQIELPITFKVV